MKACNILPDGVQDGPPQKTSKAVVNECTKFKFEDAAENVEANEAEGKNYEMTDVVSLRFPKGQVVFKSGVMVH